MTSIVTESIGTYCLSPGKVCVAGPRGPRGIPGNRGKRGPRGSKGKTGGKGIMGSPGKSGKPGMKGDVGNPGVKGEKGMNQELLALYFYLSLFIIVIVIRKKLVEILLESKTRIARLKQNDHKRLLIETYCYLLQEMYL